MSRNPVRTRDLWNRFEPELRYRVLSSHVHVQGLARNSFVRVEEEAVALVPEDGGHNGILWLVGTEVNAEERKRGQGIKWSRDRVAGSRRLLAVSGWPPGVARFGIRTAVSSELSHFRSWATACDPRWHRSVGLRSAIAERSPHVRAGTVGVANVPGPVLPDLSKAVRERIGPAELRVDHILAGLVDETPAASVADRGEPFGESRANGNCGLITTLPRASI